MLIVTIELDNSDGNEVKVVETAYTALPDRFGHHRFDEAAFNAVVDRAASRVKGAVKRA